MVVREGEERFLNLEEEGDIVIAMGDGELGDKEGIVDEEKTGSYSTSKKDVTLTRYFTIYHFISLSRLDIPIQYSI